MEKKDLIKEVYEAKIPSSYVLRELGYPEDMKRMDSPHKGKKRNNAVAIYDEGFKDFFMNNGGDAVCLHHYLTTNGDFLPIEKGEGSPYFQLKAKLLGIDLNSDNIETYKPKKIVVPKPEAVETERQKNEDLNLCNRALHNYMLNEVSRKPIINHLLERGMTLEQIKVSPFTVSPKERDIDPIINEIVNEATDVLGVPGFYEQQNGSYTMKAAPNEVNFNLMVPIVNIKKEMVSFHVRGLQPDAKYWSISSAGEKGGCSPGSPVGFWGNIKPDTTNIILTEGAVKAYLCWLWTGIPTMYVLGVGSQSTLFESLKIAKAQGVKNVLLAFDMDCATNENVEKSMAKAKEKILAAGLEVMTLKWDPRYNGIDDYLKTKLDEGTLDAAANKLQNLKKSS